MIERYNVEKHEMEMIENGAPTLGVPVFFNGSPNGDVIDATILTRDYNPCHDKVIMPKIAPHKVYPNTVGWMFDGRHMVIDGVTYRVFDRCETLEVYDALSR